MATAYATLADLRTHPGIPASGSDALLQACLDAAAAAIDYHCTGLEHSDEYFKVGGHTVTAEKHSGRRTRQIRLRRRPVLTITSVEVDGSVFDSTLYELSEDGGGGWLETVDWTDTDGYNPRIWRGDSSEKFVWPEGTNNIEVTYTYGYSAIPDKVKKACAMLAKQIYDTEIRNGVSAESNGPVSKSYTSFAGFSIPNLVASLLAPYVQLEVGT